MLQVIKRKPHMNLVVRRRARGFVTRVTKNLVARRLPELIDPPLAILRKGLNGTLVLSCNLQT